MPPRVIITHGQVTIITGTSSGSLTERLEEVLLLVLQMLEYERARREGFTVS